MRILIFFITFLFSFQAFAQKDKRFRHSGTHIIEDRNSYSIFYPLGASEYEGLVVLIHSDQANNPKAYGELILKLLEKQYIVIYPAYQSFVYSNKKEDILFISSSVKKAYKDIKKVYPKVMTLPVAYLGHSMGGIIAYELALGVDLTPKKPSCIVSLCPAEVPHHQLNELNFKKLDNYDVYLVIEEENDKFYKRGTGNTIMKKLEGAERTKYILHKSDQYGKSYHMNAWSYNHHFSSKNNTIVDYFSSKIGKTNQIDEEVYWPAIESALNCAFSRKGCSSFRE